MLHRAGDAKLTATVFASGLKVPFGIAFCRRGRLEVRLRGRDHPDRPLCLSDR